MFSVNFTELLATAAGLNPQLATVLQLAPLLVKAEQLLHVNLIPLLPRLFGYLLRIVPNKLNIKHASNYTA